MKKLLVFVTMLAMVVTFVPTVTFAADVQDEEIVANAQKLVEYVKAEGEHEGSTYALLEKKKKDYWGVIYDEEDNSLDFITSNDTWGNISFSIEMNPSTGKLNDKAAVLWAKMDDEEDEVAIALAPIDRATYTLDTNLTFTLDGETLSEPINDFFNKIVKAAMSTLDDFLREKIEPGMPFYKLGFDNLKKDITVTVDKEELTFKEGTKIGDLEKPAREGQIFLGWTDKEGRSLSDDRELVEGDLIIPSFATISLVNGKVSKTTKSSITLQWDEYAGADGYTIYGAKCNSGKHKYYCKELATVSETSTTISKLNKKTYYKFYVAPYKLVNGEKIELSRSLTLHATTTGGKYGNPKYVKISKVGKSRKAEITLAEGRTATIKAKAVKSKKVKSHEGLRYKTDDAKIATVSGKGVIKAVSPGTCKVYVYAQNGVYKTVSVTVK